MACSGTITNLSETKTEYVRLQNFQHTFVQQIVCPARRRPSGTNGPLLYVYITRIGPFPSTRPHFEPSVQHSRSLLLPGSPSDEGSHWVLRKPKNSALPCSHGDVHSVEVFVLDCYARECGRGSIPEVRWKSVG